MHMHHTPKSNLELTLSTGRPLNISRRNFLATAGALVLATSLPTRSGRAQSAPPQPTLRFNAYIEIRPDGKVLFQSLFAEGGQGISTAVAQIVGEELDIDPVNFEVVTAPPSDEYKVMFGMRFTGGSASVRATYDMMRKLGATGRQMLLQAAAARLAVPLEELTTEPGKVMHVASGRSVAYGELASDAAKLPVPNEVSLRDKANFRWIGKPVARLDTYEKSTGRTKYSIDLAVEGMLYAAIRHAPRLGQEPDELANQKTVSAMEGVNSVHRLPGAVAVLADNWWRARMAVDALGVTWKEAASGKVDAMPADFSSEGHIKTLLETKEASFDGEATGDISAGFSRAAKVIEADYVTPYLAHAQLEPSSALARFNEDGGLELWLPNQSPENFQGEAAKIAGLAPEKVMIHTPPLGGFFGRHIFYQRAHPYPNAILLAKASGRPVKLVWSREEEFLRDPLRPLSVARMRAAIDTHGDPVAIETVAVGVGPGEYWYGENPFLGRAPNAADRSAVEGLTEKQYAIPNKRVAQVPAKGPAMIGFWRSVGHSKNDFFYEAFLDEIADAGGKDPYELRLKLLAGNERLQKLLAAVGELSGGWKRGPFKAEDGSQRARGVAMASPFGTEVATIAEVSIRDGAVHVHDIWVVVDPGSAVNPAIIEAQIISAVALGLSQTLVEEFVYSGGVPVANNFDGYPILTPDRMPQVHVRIIESGAPIGGIGEVGVPGVAPAVVNAVAALTGKRVRNLPLSKTTFNT